MIKPNTTGFSLIEIVIALAVVFVALLIFGAALSSAPLTETARNQNLAYHIADKKMEELRNTPYGALPATGPFTDPGLSNLPSAAANLTVANYQGASEIKQITINISWVEGGKNRALVLETLMAENGLNQP